MLDVDCPAAQGQGIDLHASSAEPEERKTRAAALKLTADEAHRVRVAIQKVARAVGGFKRLATMLEIPSNTLYHAPRPGSRPSGMLVIRLAAVAKVPVEMILTGKLAGAPAVIGVAA